MEIEVLVNSMPSKGSPQLNILLPPLSGGQDDRLAK